MILAEDASTGSEKEMLNIPVSRSNTGKLTASGGVSAMN